MSEDNHVAFDEVVLKFPSSFTFFSALVYDYIRLLAASYQEMQTYHPQP